MSLRNHIVSFILLLYKPVARWVGPRNPYTSGIFRRFYFLYKQLVEDELETLLTNYPQLVKGGHIIDVGANIGFTVLAFSRRLESSYYVIAFEPELFNFKLLEDTLESYTLQNVKAFQFAVGETSGPGTLVINPVHPGDHRIVAQPDMIDGSPVQATSVVSLDEFLPEIQLEGLISFVKIDVQGYEFAVLKGMQNILRDNANITILLEYSSQDLQAHGISGGAIIDWLEERGFKPFVINSGGQACAFDYSTFGENQSYVNVLFSRSKLS